MENLLPEFKRQLKVSDYSEWSVNNNAPSTKAAARRRRIVTKKYGRRSVQQHGEISTKYQTHGSLQTEPEGQDLHSPYCSSNPSPLSRISTGSIASRSLRNNSNSSKKFSYKKTTSAPSSIKLVIENHLQTPLDAFLKKLKGTTIKSVGLEPHCSFAFQATGEKQNDDEDAMKKNGISVQLQEFKTFQNHHRELVALSDDSNTTMLSLTFFNGAMNSGSVDLYRVEDNDLVLHQSLETGSTVDLVTAINHPWIVHDVTTDRAIVIFLGPSCAATRSEQFSFVLDPVSLKLSFMAQTRTTNTLIEPADMTISILPQ